MKMLSVCIPNYNRLDKLGRLLREAAAQITDGNLEEHVQICVSDDCSPENPAGLIEEIREKCPDVEIRFERNVENMGMDCNFLNSVMMASAEYCWIIGNDDLPEEGAVARIVSILSEKKETDILLTPFNLYGEEGEQRGTTYPIKGNGEQVFDTSVKEQQSELIFSVRHNSGLFGFLSNVVFRRSRWVEYRELFQDKLGTIFIQMYMNIHSLKEGAVFRYSTCKIIKNYADDETNKTIDRTYRILTGLDGVVEYFFNGAEKEHLKRIMVDEYISGIMWDLPDQDPRKERVRAVDSPKNRLYKKYFIPECGRENFLAGKKFIIYGTGVFGQKTYDELKRCGADIIGVADSALSKHGSDFRGFSIMSVGEMAEECARHDAFVMAANNLSLEEMVNTLLGHGIENIGIIA